MSEFLPRIVNRNQAARVLAGTVCVAALASCSNSHEQSTINGAWRYSVSCPDGYAAGFAPNKTPAEEELIIKVICNGVRKGAHGFRVPKITPIEDAQKLETKLTIRYHAGTVDQHTNPSAVPEQPRLNQTTGELEIQGVDVYSEELASR